MTIEYDSEDVEQAEDALVEIKAAIVRLRMGTEEQKAERREELLTWINYQANAAQNLLLNGVFLDEVELSR
jgi:hypothetical protein